MLVVMAGLAAAGRITGRFAAGYAAVAGIVLVLLAETARHLLRSANVVRGSAQYYRQRGTVPAADLDRLLRRMAGEAAHMEALIDGLDARPPA
jgi:hypothetical protein